ncbi:chorismate mutase [Schizophyllum amplum]|uniref:chorismate mutase n=1 Tax=Schizophyllum amplum TaxID=97359 RepID=A0A550CGU0_9AGAR|nr:chorismate mutase [Auriculariopsis ampla]
MQSNLFSGDPLNLERIRSVLVRLEETIIFSVIERAQFAHNPSMYEPGAFAELRELGFSGSWLEWFLHEIESFHAKARRYTSPDEYAFTTNLPEPVIAAPTFPRTLYPNTVNANPTILAHYVKNVVPRITRRASLALAAAKRARGITDGRELYNDDGNYGSAATVDVELIQAISKRVHYGERKLLQRVRKKASTYAQEIIDGETVSTALKVDVEGLVDLYESFIIPLTKDVEVDYLLQRLDGLSEQEIEELKTRGKSGATAPPPAPTETNGVSHNQQP